VVVKDPRHKKLLLENRTCGCSSTTRLVHLGPPLPLAFHCEGF